MVSSVARGAPTERAVRRLLVVAALLVLLAGLQLFVFPLRTDEWFAWTIGSPMTAVFLGAAYWSAVGLELAAARASRWADAKIAIPAVLVFTTLTLVVTIVHRDLFHFDSELPLRTRLVTWAWLAIYAAVPVLMALAVRRQQRVPDRPAPAAGLPATVRATLVLLATVLVLLGVALLVDPGWADAAWPWPLTDLTGRAVGAWLVGLGVAAGHARLLDDVRTIRPLAITGVAFVVLQSVALLRHGEELDWSSASALAYMVVLAVLGSVSMWALLGSRRSARPRVES